MLAVVDAHEVELGRFVSAVAEHLLVEPPPPVADLARIVITGK